MKNLAKEMAKRKVKWEMLLKEQKLLEIGKNIK